MKRLIPLLMLLTACSRPFGPVPSEAQLEWQKMEMNMFVHFGPNTFSGAEWGSGEEPEDLFNPTGLDCRQWAAIARDAGMKGIIITAKHHDGFCLWPSPESTHSVASSSWRDGKGDVLKELSDACREYGLKFGVYISPWDRNDPAYGTPEYNEKYAATLRSVHDGRYGPIFEQWFDGACGEGPGGKRQEYDWDLFNGTVLSLQPRAIIFSDWGPGCRWVGNENGIAPETCLSTLDGAWVPPEADVSIRPGWFWRESENGAVKTVDQLMDIYYRSVGRNALLLLNVPPDTRGRIHPVDSARLSEFGRRIREEFADNLALCGKLSDGDYGTWRKVRRPLVVPLRPGRPVSRIVLQEYIPLGQRVESFVVEAHVDGSWQEAARGTTIGYKRILRIPPVTADALRITLSGPATPILCEVGAY